MTENAYEAGTTLAEEQDQEKSRAVLKKMDDGRFLVTRQRYNDNLKSWFDIKGVQVPEKFLNPTLLK